MKKSVLILIILNFLILFPIIFLCFYNYPSADDFSYGVALKNNSFVDIQIQRYLDWTSRYIATGVLTVSPLAFNSINYFGIYSLVFIVLFFVGFLYFLKSTGNWLLSSNHTSAKTNPIDSRIPILKPVFIAELRLLLKNLLLT